METFQRDYITKNQKELASLIICSEDLKDYLVSKCILSTYEKQQLTNHGNSYGSISESRDMLEKLYGKQNAYLVLIDALGHTGQVQARNLLTALYRNNATKTGLGLDAAEELLSMKVEFHGKTCAIKELLPHLTLVSSLCVFHCPEKRMEFIQLRLQNKPISGLQRKISKPHPLYRTRWLSTRSIVNPVAFRNHKYNDIFLFQGVTVNELSYLADPHNVQASTDWSRGKFETCRFISLDEEDHKEFIIESSKGPVHLISKEGKNFVLLQTYNVSTQNNSWLRQEMTDFAEFSEASFVTNVLLGCKYQGVCFCHCSGEGKSLLLGSLARKLQEQHPNAIYFVVELSKLAKNLRDFQPMNESYDGLLKLLEFCCNSKLNGFIMHQYIHQRMETIHFFMDGLDELSIDSQKNMIKFLKDIKNIYPGRIVLIISSGVHSRNDLEKILHVTSFDILPFNKKDHIEFLVQFWMLQLPNVDKTDIILCANSMIQAITSLQRAHHKAIGTPLVCNLLALVYKEQVEQFKQNRSDGILNFEKTSTILDLYDNFLATLLRWANVNKKTNTLSTCSPNFLEQVTQYHTLHAVDSLFRDFAQTCFQSIKFTEDSELLGVINSGLSIAPNLCLEGFFSHRSVSEFLSAKFFADFLMNLESQKFTFDFVKQVLLFFTQDVMTPMSFRQESLTCINKNWKDMTITVPLFAMGTLPVFINSMLERNNCYLILKETIGRMKKELHLESTSYATLKTNVYGIFLCCIDGRLNALLSLLVALIKAFVIDEPILSLLTAPGSYFQLAGTYYDVENKHKWLTSDVQKVSLAFILQKLTLCGSLEATHEILDWIWDGSNIEIGTLFPKEWISPIETAIQQNNIDMVKLWISKFSVAGQTFLLKIVNGKQMNEGQVEKRREICRCLVKRCPQLCYEINQVSLEKHLIEQSYDSGLNVKAITVLLPEFSKVKLEDLLPHVKSLLLKFAFQDMNDEQLITVMLQLFPKKSSGAVFFDMFTDSSFEYHRSVLSRLDLENVESGFKHLQVSFFSFQHIHSVETLKVLTSVCKDFATCNADGSNYLHYAVRKGLVDWVEYLLKEKYDIDKKNHHGYTPLLCISTNFPIEITKLLLKNGANVNVHAFYHTKNIAQIFLEVCGNHFIDLYHDWSLFMIKSGYAFLWQEDTTHGTNLLAEISNNYLPEHKRTLEMIQQVCKDLEKGQTTTKSKFTDYCMLL